jgi:sugar transferase (PEP-CTERM system associated)
MQRVLHPNRTGGRALGVLYDASLVMACVCAAIAWQSGNRGDLALLAGTCGGSIAAGMSIINAANGLYEPTETRSTQTIVWRTLFTLLLALGLTYAAFVFTGFDRRADLMVPAMVAVGAVILRRAYVTHLASNPAKQRSRTLIFGCGQAARVVGHTLIAADPDVEIVGYFPGPNEKHPAVPSELILPATMSLTETAQSLHVDEVVVALTERRAGSMPLRELLDCKLRGIKVYDLNSHFEKRLGQIRIDYLNAGWLIFGDGFNQGVGRTAVKRIFDLVCATVLIVLASPFMLATAVLIRLDSRGPVLYRQERVGLNGQPFDVVKFRSMKQDAESDGKPVWATSGDSRVTRVGKLIRKSRIDELPQLFSVLNGHMSLVGPRPERPFFVEQLTREIPFYAVRHSVKPGVTGWAQVRYQYGSTIEDSQEKLQYDLHYVKNHSLWLDLQVLAHTVHVVLTGKGAC